MSVARLLVVLFLVTATAAIAGAAKEPVASPVAPFEIPYTLGAWHGADASAGEDETDPTLGADLVVNRAYADVEGHEAGLYVAYYNQQRPGVSIHSPLHCLPGTGWEVVSNDTVGVGLLDGTTRPVRRLIAEKDSSRVMVLYWYDINGEMITSELGSRLQLFTNRVRLGRNDAALVRIAVPVTDSDGTAEQEAVAFARVLVPHL
jgi:EpsI family protein